VSKLSNSALTGVGDFAKMRDGRKPDAALTKTLRIFAEVQPGPTLIGTSGLGGRPHARRSA